MKSGTKKICCNNYNIYSWFKPKYALLDSNVGINYFLVSLKEIGSE